MGDVGLLHTPVEVIQQIGDNVRPTLLLLIFSLVGTAAPPRHEVVTTCSWLNLCMEPMVLSCVTLDIFNHTTTTTTRQLETLASQRSHASKFARTFKIASLIPRHDSTLLEECVRYLMMWEPSADMAEACVKKYLATAISSLENVRSVM